MFLSDDEVLGENQKPPQDQNHCDTIELEQFLRFWTHPPEYLLNQVLALRFPKQSESIEEREPFVLNGLERYALGDAILQGILRGRNEDKIQKDIRASGQLPFGGFGDFTFAKTFDEASALAQIIEAEQFQAFDDPVYVNIPLSKGHLRGALTQVGPSGILDFGFARVGSKQMLRLWIRHLCLCASTDASEVSQKSVHIGRGKDGPKKTRICFGPIDNPKETLESLVTLFLFGSSRALPFFPKSSAAYATKMVTPTLKKDGTPRGDPPSDALRDARKAWNDTVRGNKVIIEGEWRNAAIQRLFGTEAPFDPGASGFVEITLAVFRPLLENWSAQT
jgi:exodeoxyribonuclease V gamma subunit